VRRGKVPRIRGRTVTAWKRKVGPLCRPKAAGAVAFLLLLGAGICAVWLLCPPEVGVAVTAGLVTPPLLACARKAVRELRLSLTSSQPPNGEPPRRSHTPPRPTRVRSDRRKRPGGHVRPLYRGRARDRCHAD
jgi:hypothetical protein